MIPTNFFDPEFNNAYKILVEHLKLQTLQLLVVEIWRPAGKL